jgi:uncharacterized protein (TIGR02147 family)
MSLFEFDNYRSYLRDYIKSLPRKGRGELSNIAKHLNINTTLLSQIMSGTREFTQEQAYSLSLYLGHLELEMDYFSLLVQIERAATVDLREHLQRKISAIKKESLKLSRRMTYDKKLSDQERSVFYSSWIYSAVHIFTSLNDKGVTLEEISKRFSLTKTKTAEVLQFLAQAGIVIEKTGRYKPGLQSTFVEQGSPHLLKHHSSWRVKAIQKSEALTDAELMVTGQYSLSKKDFLALREKFTDLVKHISEAIKVSDPEEIVCLNIDWFLLDK